MSGVNISSPASLCPLASDPLSTMPLRHFRGKGCRRFSFAKPACRSTNNMVERALKKAILNRKNAPLL